MDYSDKERVVFDEASTVSGRLDEIQKQITLCSLNPAAMNQAYGEFNYKLWLNWLIAFQREIGDDFNEDEEKKAEELRDAIIGFNKKYPIYKTIKLKVHPYTSIPKLDEKALGIIVLRLNDYGTYLNKLKKQKKSKNEGIKNRRG